jgi:hypothetical protein
LRGRSASTAAAHVRRARLRRRRTNTEQGRDPGRAGAQAPRRRDRRAQRLPAKCACAGWRVSATSPCSAFLIPSTANLSRHTSMPIPPQSCARTTFVSTIGRTSQIAGCRGWSSLTTILDNDLPREDFGELLERKLTGRTGPARLSGSHGRGVASPGGRGLRCGPGPRHGLRDGQAR